MSARVTRSSVEVKASPPFIRKGQLECNRKTSLGKFCHTTCVSSTRRLQGSIGKELQVLTHSGAPRTTRHAAEIESSL